MQVDVSRKEQWDFLSLQAGSEVLVLVKFDNDANEKAAVNHPYIIGDTNESIASNRKISHMALLCAMKKTTILYLKWANIFR